MTSDRIKDYKVVIACLWRGHDKTWDDTIFAPRWTCRRCGQSGDLQDHTRMPLRYHALAAIPTLLIGILLWLFLF